MMFFVMFSVYIGFSLYVLSIIIDDWFRFVEVNLLKRSLVFEERICVLLFEKERGMFIIRCF